MKTPPEFPKGHRPQVFSDPAVDQLHAAYVTVATELAVALERIDTLERALIAGGEITRERLEQLSLDASQDPDRLRMRNELAERLLRPFRMFREAHIAEGHSANHLSDTP